MARANRLSYKEATKAKVSGRLKELMVVVLLAVAGILVSVSINAQSYNQSAKRFNRTDKKQCQVLAKKRYQKSRPSKRFYFQTSQKKETTNSLVDDRLTQFNAFERSIIREMVTNHLRESNSPVELAPLLFTLHEDKLQADDANPLLIAVEFGLQGKTIVIAENNGNLLAVEIKSLMLNMGVPANRIHLQEFIPRLLLVDESRQENRRVDFKAI